MWDAILPECCLGLPPGLAAVDRLLDDPRFFEPFVPFFSARTGRPSIPMETYLRMMFLRFRYKLGFETLCAEVADSIAWRRFCRIPLDRPVPHPTTLLKITARAARRLSRRSTRRCWPRRPKQAGPARRGPGGYHGGARPTWPIRPTAGFWPKAWPAWPPGRQIEGGRAGPADPVQGPDPLGAPAGS